jgi:hypothetical protein
MTDNLPAHPDDDLAPGLHVGGVESYSNADIISGLRNLFVQMDDRRIALAKEGNVEALAHGAADVDLLAGELSTIKRSAQADIARIFAATGEKKREIPGLGIVEVKGGSDRKNWQSRKVLRQIVMRAITDSETGELIVDSAKGAADAIEEAISTALGMTGSTSWKVGAWDATAEEWKGGLRSLGIDPADYCDEVPKPNLAVIPRRKLETPDE